MKGSELPTLFTSPREPAFDLWKDPGSPGGSAGPPAVSIRDLAHERRGLLGFVCPGNGSTAVLLQFVEICQATLLSFTQTPTVELDEFFLFGDVML